MTIFVQYILNGILIGCLYALITMAFIVIYRSSRIFNLAQGQIVMVGGYVSWTLLTKTPLPIWLSILVALAITAGVGLLIERLVLRPLIGQPLFALVMVTIALMVVIQGATQLLWGPMTLMYPNIFPNQPFVVGPFILTQSMVWGAVVVLLLTPLLWWLFHWTKLGLTLSAVAEDHQVARALGIDVKRSIAISWALAALLSTMAAIYWLSSGVITLGVSEIGLISLPCVLLAGLESIPGALLAGLVVGIGQSIAGGYLDPFARGGVSLVFPFLIMLAILLVRPQGFFGWKRIERL